MSREVRMVPADWQHPTDGSYPNGDPRYVPLIDEPYSEALDRWRDEELPEWEEGQRLWGEGKVKTLRGVKTIAEVVAETAEYRRPINPTYEWWAGERPEKPNPEWYMPNWPDNERTHFMMYESVSEGTPISPAFATAEELARWLADSGASAFAGETATYEQWLSTIRRGGTACSGVMIDGQWQSSVAFEAESRA